MLTREACEKREYEILSPLATHAAETRGRLEDEVKCDYRTEFQRDRDRIIHSKSFRRLMHKTQVYISPEYDHYRTRLTHTIEVSQIARTIARLLRYNEDLTEAIALGHDLGHTPFGHIGEFVLNEIHPSGFEHNVQSLRTVDVLEPTTRRNGLNLTAEVRDGILNHRGGTLPFTLEGQIVRISDRIAYINHDIDDALRGNVLKESDFPKYDFEVLGFTHGDRINNLIVDLCRNSEGKNTISLSDDFNKALLDLREFMFKNVYLSDKVIGKEKKEQAENIVRSLYEYYLANPDDLPPLYKKIASKDGLEEAVKDNVAGMTDRYAGNLYKELFLQADDRSEDGL